MRRLWRRINRSLGTKLALVLVLVALLPLLTVSVLGARIALGRLEREVLLQTGETAQVAMNLLLRRVQGIADDTRQIADAPELHELVALEPELVPRFLNVRAKLQTTALVEVALMDQTIVASVHPRQWRKAEVKQLQSRADSIQLRRALNYERYVSFEQVGERLVVRSSAPIVDAMFVLRGAVVTTVPLDAHMADYIRGVVQAEIGFLAGRTPIASTFVDPGGRRLVGYRPAEELAQQVRWGRTSLTQARVGGGDYALAFTPLQTVQGRRIGMMSVGISLQQLQQTKLSALRSLVLGALGGLIFAVAIAYMMGRRITVPLSRLRRSTAAVASGNLDLELAAVGDRWIGQQDEIGDLARAFHKMTVSLREHQNRLDARVRELSTLHQIGRAVGSVLSLDQVLKLVLEKMVEVLGAERGALLLLEKGELHLGAGIGLPAGKDALPEAWEEEARMATSQHGALVEGTTIAVPLETRDRVLGALVAARRAGAGSFSEGDLRLVVTFCDQASTAIENARLYDEVRAFSVDLERQVAERTSELRAANQDLERALKELKDAQSQLIHSEKMAGLGTLVAGVAHEINTPAGAIHGSAQLLGECLERVVQRLRRLTACETSAEEVSRFFDAVDQVRSGVGTVKPLSPTQLRRQSRDYAARLEEYGVADAQRLARRIVEANAQGILELVTGLKEKVPPELLVGLVEDFVYLKRTSLAIKSAIGAIVRLVGTLKTYAHADHASAMETDLTQGIETTLTILHNAMRYGITVNRSYDAELPKVRVFADELNQVWTNLIQNSLQAMKGEGTIEIETFSREGYACIRIVDDGPGIDVAAMPRIFEPFFTTKPRGEGTGLGLSIVQRIVDRHGGRIEATSEPGRTAFTVMLPLSGPLPERE